MNVFNKLMNHVDALSYSERFLVRTFSTRFVVVGGIPLELLASLQNLLHLSLQPFGMALKYSIKAFNICLDSSTLKNFEEAYLPGITDLFITAYKVVGFALGSVFSLTFGLVSPYLNFRLHTILSLVTDEKALAMNRQLTLQASQQREAQEIALQAQVHALMVAMKKKIADQERKRVEEEVKNMRAAELIRATRMEEKRMEELKNQRIMTHITVDEEKVDLLGRVWQRGSRLFGYQAAKPVSA